MVARVGHHELTVRAPIVVVAAGGLMTPAILLRSGVKGTALGRHLRLHPVTAVWGRFAEPVEPWTGMMQASYSDQYADLDGAGYGFRFETAAVHPLFPGVFIGWEDGATFKRDLHSLRYLSPVGILLRDRDGGKVGVRGDGSAKWSFRLSDRDTKHMRTGVVAAAELLAAAGAEEVISSTSRPVRWRPGSGSLADFVDGVDTVGYGPNQTTYVSFHQMGSARMGSDPGASATDDRGRVHGVDGLYVMDGSTFPTASGVNPMISIETVAHMLATRLPR